MGAAITVALWLWAVGDVRAEDAVVLAVGGSPEVPESEWDQAVLAASTELERQGFRLPAGAAISVPTDCVADTCLQAQRTQRGVVLLAAVSVFVRSDTPGHAGDVLVTVVTEAGAFLGEASVEGGQIDVAIRRALLAARERSARGSAPWLVVRGSPSGAMIVIDGVETGVLPWEGTVAEGDHRVEVRLGGYVSSTSEVHVVTGEPSMVDVALVSAGGARDAWPSYVLGGGLVAGGLALTIPAWITVAQQGQCTERDPLGCTTYYGFGAKDVGWLIAGGVLAAAGIVVLALQPLAIEVRASTAGLELRGSF